RVNGTAPGGGGQLGLDRGRIGRVEEPGVSQLLQACEAERETKECAQRKQRAAEHVRRRRWLGCHFITSRCACTLGRERDDHMNQFDGRDISLSSSVSPSERYASSSWAVCSFRIACSPYRVARRSATSASSGTRSPISAMSRPSRAVW